MTAKSMNAGEWAILLSLAIGGLVGLLLALLFTAGMPARAQTAPDARTPTIQAAPLADRLTGRFGSVPRTVSSWL